MIPSSAVGHITTALGLGEKDKTNPIFSTVCALSLGIGIFLTLLLFTFSAELFALIYPEYLVISGAVAVRLFSVSLVGVAITFIMIYYYTGVNQNTTGNILSLTEGFFAVIPAAWVF